MIADIFYLPFDSSELPDTDVDPEELIDLRYDLNYTDEGRSVTAFEFDRYYRYVGSESVTNPDDNHSRALAAVWERWNAGSGRETDKFRMARERSMSAGDVIRLDGRAYQCDPVGWHRVEALDEDRREGKQGGNAS